MRCFKTGRGKRQTRGLRRAVLTGQPFDGNNALYTLEFGITGQGRLPFPDGRRHEETISIGKWIFGLQAGGRDHLLEIIRRTADGEAGEDGPIYAGLPRLGQKKVADPVTAVFPGKKC